MKILNDRDSGKIALIENMIGRKASEVNDKQRKKISAALDGEPFLRTERIFVYEAENSEDVDGFFINLSGELVLVVSTAALEASKVAFWGICQAAGVELLTIGPEASNEG